MEIIIIISLVIIIALLLLDKNKISKQGNQSKIEELPFKQDVSVSIIGESKPVTLKQSQMSQTEDELDLEEEEKELSESLQPIIDNEFTERVSMDELNGFVNSIEEELINETTVKIAKKIEGSDLLELLQQALPDSAKTIAKLLDQSLNEKSPKKAKVIDSEDFNINDFV
ncbi:hypothetical protein [Myroides marinus]|uniref:hypothetical protein n=1 Tax=Myroides TaxID=76831 RepID=UPI00257922DC|nr:hypothetical protein [Myroides marinus]MDM1354419.1 hypothetical protein [Myroides marinus]MDM1534209.1 hypothetical protein [Myroides marinus]MDM1541175.1 hypothetical protein [Myroides marinus]